MFLSESSNHRSRSLPLDREVDGQSHAQRPSYYPGLAGKVVVCTGAAAGIGLAMAHAFARHDAHLVLLDVNPDTLSAAQASLRQQYPDIDVDAICVSVMDSEAVERAFQAIDARYGRVDVLLNNAGISMNRPTLTLAPDDWRRAVDINLNGLFYCCQQAAQRMTRDGSGVILNTASMYGIVAAPERAAYCASKAAVVALSKSLALEWAPHGVRVNAICPGYIRTDLVNDLVARGALDADVLAARTPMRRLGTPEEIAEAALFLASDGAAFVTGHAYVADGGWTANGYL